MWTARFPAKASSAKMFRKMIKYELIDVNKWHREVNLHLPGGTAHRIMTITFQKMVDIYTDTVQNTEPFHIRYIARKVIEQRSGFIPYQGSDEMASEQGHLTISGSPWSW